MAITDKEEGVWNVDQVYNKINQGGIWDYDGTPATMTWGQNSFGYRGLNDVIVRSSPTQLPGTWNIGQGSAQPTVTLATDSTGALWTWGGNWEGNLGLNDTVHRSSPTQIGTDTTWGTDHTEKISSGTTTLAVKTDGTLWAWGKNDQSQLGLNSTTQYSSPTQVGTDTNWSTVGGGYATTNMAIKTDGTLWGWGNNYWGYLASNDRTPYSSPRQVGTDTNWSKVAKGPGMGQKTDGTIWMWSYNGYGQLGQNATQHKSSPCQVGTKTDWTSFDTNLYTAAGVRGGELYIWGSNISGGLGLNQSFPGNDISSPTLIPGTNWNEVLMGSYGATNVGMLATKTDGTLWTWGSNYMGMLGHNKTQSDLAGLSSPTQIPGNWSNLRDGMYGYYADSVL